MATWLGISTTHDFTVLNANNDDVEPVAGDGIDDAWQFQYFDINGDGFLSPSDALRAAANANPDGDHQDNTFEFLAGYSPADPESHLKFTLLGTTDLSATDPWSILGTPLVGQDQQPFRAQHPGGTTHFYKIILTPAP